MKDSKRPYALEKKIYQQVELDAHAHNEENREANTTTHLIKSPSVEMMETTHLLELLESTHEHVSHHLDIHNHITKVMIKSLVKT